ncbi:lasso peptide biosynthesis B2 protein [Radiobacillus sp. PE A8.2]|uniref:lasso peptide biosynthesis B2 protein n=1 Tax=Radiobacillus sp. PE A8.2 TaxID=3380349 RepID=UPI00388F19C6
MLLRKIKRFLHIPFRKKLLYIEAYFNLARARILKAMPFSRVSRLLGEEWLETAQEDSEDLSIKRDVAKAITTISKYTIWESACLVQAIAAMKMLERRNIESTLYMGTAKDDAGKLIAHAWLRSGTAYISGGKIMHNFTVVRVFAKLLEK